MGVLKIFLLISEKISGKNSFVFYIPPLYFLKYFSIFYKRDIKYYERYNLQMDLYGVRKELYRSNNK